MGNATYDELHSMEFFFFWVVGGLVPVHKNVLLVREKSGGTSDCVMEFGHRKRNVLVQCGFRFIERRDLIVDSRY